MGLDVFEIFFWWLGRFTWKFFPVWLTQNKNLGDGSYEVIGFFLSVLIAVILFNIWSFVYA